MDQRMILNEALKGSFDAHRKLDEIIQIIRSSTLFGSWDALAINRCCNCSLRNFYEGEVLPSRPAQHELTSCCSRSTAKGSCRTAYLACGSIGTPGKTRSSVQVEACNSSDHIESARATACGSCGHLRLSPKHTLHVQPLTAMVGHCPVKDDANVFVTYFILEGSATVVQRLVVEKYKLKGDKRFRYLLHRNQALSPSRKTSRIEFVFMQTCILQKGACFGLGENLSKHTLKANKGLKCLVIPKHILHQNFTPDNIWKRIILFLDMNYPSLEEVFNLFVAGREWHQDSKEFNRKEKFLTRHSLGTTVHDVPLSIRTDNIFLANKFKRSEMDPYYLFGEKHKQVGNHAFNSGNRARPSVIGSFDFQDLPELKKSVDRGSSAENKELIIDENPIEQQIETYDCLPGTEVVHATPTMTQEDT